jgi:O-antigen/teichoic acid export membrane protein
MIIVTPYWSAVTDAFFKNEFDWIKRNMRKLIQMATLFCAGLALMLLLSKPVFHCWIQDRVHIPLSLSVAMTVYNMTVMYMAPYNMFLNGFGKLKLGTNIAIIKTIAYLPLAWFLASKYGALGLVLALFIANMLPNLLTSIKQYSLVVNQKAYGIWDE